MRGPRCGGDSTGVAGIEVAGRIRLPMRSGSNPNFFAIPLNRGTESVSICDDAGQAGWVVHPDVRGELRRAAPTPRCEGSRPTVMGGGFWPEVFGHPPGSESWRYAGDHSARSREIVEFGSSGVLPVTTGARFAWPLDAAAHDHSHDRLQDAGVSRRGRGPPC